jgi:hypothetical protein
MRKWEEAFVNIRTGTLETEKVIQCESFVQQKSRNGKIYRTIILTVVLYGSGTWSLTLREGYRLRVSENRPLRLFGSKRDKVIEDWKKLHNEVLYDLHSSPNIF